jgi:hypothetical protein
MFLAWSSEYLINKTFHVFLVVFFRNDKLDLYIDDTPLLEYALSKYDDNCSIKFASHYFGENAYAFGVKKGSMLKVCSLKIIKFWSIKHILTEDVKNHISY